METWGPLLTSVVLAAITAWYAVLTRSLAKSARDSAESARLAAQFAANSAAATTASVKVAFGISPSYELESAAEDDVWLGVTLLGTGATVYVHGVTLDSAHRCIEWDEDGATYETITLGPVRTIPSDDVTLPARLHEGETLHFATSVQIGSLEAVALMDATVRYSLDISEEPVDRRVAWRGEVDRDFERPRG